MLDEDWKCAKELFSTALELPASERERFFAALVDPIEVIAEARSLLANYLESPDFLEGVTAPLPEEESKIAPDFAGRRAGAWQLKREIGHGGMGVVWEAERADGQFEQRAALKLLRGSLFSDRDRRRFREERQILASLNHPNIARLLDGGMLEDGSPFLVMEYVDGEPIDQWCDRNRLDLRQRIELCLEVCAAVEYAHSQLVIHRDLKPANIFVTADGPPKLLDFGIAKLIASNGDDHETTARLLTPECASPEQVRGERMSTATDVFALGVLFYRLFTGQHPFVALETNPLAALRAVCEQEPRLPSTIAGAWRRELRGELDAIVLQALRKNPAERYSTVHALAADLRAWLDGRTVNAVRLPWWRRTARLVGRYRVQSAAIAVAVLSLLSGIVVTTIEAKHARQAEQEALLQRDHAQSSQRLAQDERDRALSAQRAALAAELAAAADRNRALAESRRADNEAAAANNINAFLEKDLLAQASPDDQADSNIQPDPDLKVRTALDRAAARVQGKFAGQPLVEASIRLTIGKSYYDLGLLPQAQTQFARAVELQRKTLGEDAPETLRSMQLLAVAYRDQVQYAAAEPILKHVYQAQQRIQGEDRAETLNAAADLATLYGFMGRYADAESILRRVVEKRRKLYPHALLELQDSTGSLVTIYTSEGKYDLALPLAIESLSLSRRLHGEDHPATLDSLDALGNVYRWLGNLEEAEKLYKESLEGSRRVLGPQHLGTLQMINNLAVVYRQEGRYAEAAELLTGLVATNRRLHGNEDYATLANECNLVLTLESLGRFAEALPIAIKNQETLRRVFGETDRATISSTAALALVYRAQGKYKEAETLLPLLAATTKRAQGDSTPLYATTITSLGVLYQDEGKAAQAEETLTQALALDRKTTPGSLTLRTCLTALARLRLEQQRYTEAEALLRQAMTGTGNQNMQLWDTFDRQSLLGAALAGQGKYAEAEPLLVAGYEGLKKLSPAISVDANLPEAGQRLVRLYSAWGKPDNAGEWRQKLASAEKLPIP